MDQKFWDKIDSFRQNREYDKIISKIKEEIPEFWDKMDISEEALKKIFNKEIDYSVPEDLIVLLP